VADRIELAVREELGRRVDPGEPILAAVSGGADSVALLHLLHRLAPRRGSRLSVAHLDHGLRRGAAADRRFVERLAASLGLTCVTERRPVAELSRRGESPEEAARRVRRTFLLEARRRAGARWIATGHHLDDQAETILMRLVRGAGATALTGMAPVGPGPFVRPLLGIERAELRAWLGRRGIEFREDRSNRDLRFDRNRVRLQVLPLLARTLNPRAARHLVKAARLLREDSLLLDDQARAALAAISAVRGGAVSLDCDALGRLPGPLARRVARLALAAAGADGRRVAALHVEALLGLGRGPARRSLDLPGGLVARRGRTRLTLGPR
jgi:tRNA(Ile)-lysidine synthase